MTTIKEAAKNLLSVCDGAITRDGQGYTGMDSHFVRDVLNRDYFTYNQERAIHKILKKYKVQLLNSFGINYDELKFEVAEKNFINPITKKSILQISLKNGKILIESDYEYKDKIKELPERQWNPDLKVWEVPLSLLKIVVDKFPESNLSIAIKKSKL